LVFRFGVSRFTTVPWDFERGKEYAALGVEAIEDELDGEHFPERSAQVEIRATQGIGYHGAYTLEILSQNVPGSL
jgi:hypothetical protein